MILFKFSWVTGPEIGRLTLTWAFGQATLTHSYKFLFVVWPLHCSAEAGWRNSWFVHQLWLDMECHEWISIRCPTS